MSRGALLSLRLASKGELDKDVKVGGSLRCSDHGSLEFRILREGSRAKIRIASPDFGRAHIGLFRGQLQSMP